MWLTALVAAEHALIVWVEMFSWEKTGPRVFRSLPVTLFAPTKTMAANQGLYNAFLVAGLLWALIAGDALWQLLHQPIAGRPQVRYFFIEEVAALAVGCLRSKHA